MTAIAGNAISTYPISGSQSFYHTGTGAWVAGEASVFGSGAAGIAGTGAWTTNTFTVESSGTIGRSGVGDWMSATTVVSGAGNRTISGTATWAAGSSIVSGVGDISVIGIGVLLSTLATVTAVGNRGINGTGTWVSGDNELHARDTGIVFYPTLQSFFWSYPGLIGQVDDRFRQWLVSKGYTDPKHNYDLFDEYLLDNGYVGTSLWDKYHAAISDGWLWDQ